MIKNNSITFAVWGNDSPLEIQLEPEAFTLTVYTNQEVTFVPVNPIKEFSWAIKYSTNGIQLFPETTGSYEKIQVYRNGQKSDEFDFIWK